MNEENDFKLPPVLYKYRSWIESFWIEGTKYERINHNTEELLKEGIIYAAKPSELNDPFDCALPYLLSDKALSDEYLSKVIPELLKKEDENISSTEISIRTNDFLKKTKEERIKLFNQSLNKSKDLIESKYKIFCASKLSLNQLMWSHYASSHTGLSIGLDSAILHSTLKDTYENHVIPGKTNHEGEYPKIDELPDPKTMSNAGKVQLTNALLFTKGKRWVYEKEYRFILLGDDQKVRLPKECFKSFTLGVNMKKRKDELIDLIKLHYQSAKIFQANMSTSHFKLVKKQIK